MIIESYATLSQHTVTMPALNYLGISRDKQKSIRTVETSNVSNFSRLDSLRKILITIEIPRHATKDDANRGGIEETQRRSRDPAADVLLL